jgi:hypothetical protein
MKCCSISEFEEETFDAAQILKKWIHVFCEIIVDVACVSALVC